MPEYHEDPFGSPMVGHNAIRAYWLDGANTTGQVEFTVERHWVSGDVVLTAWHASYVERGDGARVRLAGFMTWDMRRRRTDQPPARMDGTGPGLGSRPGRGREDRWPETSRSTS